MPLSAIQKWKIGTGIFITKTNNYYSFTAFSTQISQAGRSLNVPFCARPFSAPVPGRLHERNLKWVACSRNKTIRRQCIEEMYRMMTKWVGQESGRVLFSLLPRRLTFLRRFAFGCLFSLRTTFGAVGFGFTITFTFSGGFLRLLFLIVRRRFSRLFRRGTAFRLEFLGERRIFIR
jgi:hypothetical protein